VVVVAEVFAPLDLLPALADRLRRDVAPMNRSGAASCECHSSDWRKTGVAGADLLDRPAARLCTPETLCNVTQRTVWAPVPGGPAPRCEVNVLGARPRGSLVVASGVSSHSGAYGATRTKPGWAYRGRLPEHLTAGARRAICDREPQSETDAAPGAGTSCTCSCGRREGTASEARIPRPTTPAQIAKVIV
jgi:hypothetical protein